jgi:formylglycine-generating enzyme required for sulfatase activity
VLVAATGVTPCTLRVWPGLYRIVVGDDSAFAECTRTFLAPGRYRIAAPLRPAAQRGMLLVPAGSATVGQEARAGLVYGAERVEHPAFLVDRHEVTCGEYAGYMEATGAAPPRTWDGPYDPAWADLPVCGVDFAQATAYAEWAGKRLPTWIEWQVTARGRDGAPFPWGTDPTPVATLPTIGSPPDTRWQLGVRAVGTTTADESWCGARDMLGNVHEWTETPFVSHLGGVPFPVLAWRVRGGNGFTAARTSRALLLGAVGAGPPETADTGFRCAKSARP